MAYYDLKLYKAIYGCHTIGELMDKGCPKCGRKLYAEGSVMFGTLMCGTHGGYLNFNPTKREKWGWASKSWKNLFTGETSADWKRRRIGG